MANFKGRSCLLIAPRFFLYEDKITHELRRLGMRVYYCDERVGNDFFSKAITRLGIKTLLFWQIRKHYGEIIKMCRSVNYDYVWVINPETITPRLFNELKSVNIGSKFILYMWDSFSNKIQAKKLVGLFDIAYTFDYKDALSYQQLHFLPLYFIDEYRLVRRRENKFCVSFIGTAHSDRAQVVWNIKSALRVKNLSMYSYLYLSHILTYLYNKLLNSSYRGKSMRDFRFRTLSHEEIALVFSRSKAVLDINHPKQSGLTNRTFEILASGSKLVTTNDNIKKYEFYTTDMIHIIDRNFPVIPDSFLLKNVEGSIEAMQRSMDKYGISPFIQNIFSKTPRDLNYFIKTHD